VKLFLARSNVLLAMLSLLSTSLSADVKVPFEHGLGQSLFEDNCGSCHGVQGMGSDEGPPLMHKLYVPSHHGDKSFYQAAMRGARAHHWPFGDMPPIEGISKRALDSIVPYIRWLQQEHKLF
jgi:mono/diheme cytochrome c family protein